MNSRDLRIYIYDVLLERGLPPSALEIGRHFGRSEREVKHAIADLKIGKTVLPHRVTREVWMAGPFASEPSEYRVEGKHVTWYANCAWDMLGIPMIAKEWVTISAQCTESREPIRISADPEGPPGNDLVVHFLVPARRWYDDIGHT
jgi:hypothetical protein